MIGPFSTTLIPLSSSSSVDRQVLINVEASAISRDERKLGFIFTKISVHKAFGWRRKKRIKELGSDRLYFQFVCAPPNVFSTSRHCSSSNTSVQHQPRWCDGSHSAPKRPPHTSLLVERRQSDEANQNMGIIRRPWRSVVDGWIWPGCRGFLITTESQDLGLTSHPKDPKVFFVTHQKEKSQMRSL